MSREDIVKDIKKKHFILYQDGSEGDIENIFDPALRAYVESEEIKGQPKDMPPSIKAMRELELIDYEPASDSGHFRFYPKGNMIFELLKDWADEIALNRLLAMQIDSPIIYSWDDKEIRSQAGSFHERHYMVNDKFILRFAGDFGLFKIMKNAQFSHRMLPLRIYEFSKSFRYEKKGELSGLKRLRGFHMPDVHCFCRDLAQGWEEYQLLFKRYVDLSDAMGVEYAIGFRIVESFYVEHKDKLVELVNYCKKPVFIEVLSSMKHYWAVKNEFQGIDSVRGNVQLATVQLDVKDADVYGIRYADSNGSKKGCIICHSSIGSIERWIYMILEEAFKMERPCLPVWLSPVQLRMIPVSDKHVKACDLGIDVRYDIDDRSDSISKKLVKARKAWIPYVAVVGDREIGSGVFELERRIDGEKIKVSAGQIRDLIRDDMPYRPLPVPKLVSKQPRF